MVLTLITQPGNKNTFKSLIAAKYAGVELTIPEGFEFGKTNRTPEFLKQNPNGKVRISKRPPPGLSMQHQNAVHHYNDVGKNSAIMKLTPRFEKSKAYMSACMRNPPHSTSRVS